MHEVIINFAPTGMLPGKSDTPHVPLSVSEIVEDVLRANEIGITMAHLHARDGTSGMPTSRAEVFASIIEGIRAYAPELILCVTCSGRHANTFEQRSAVLRLDGSAKPDMGSLTLSSLNFSHQASINAPDMIQALAQLMLARGILPELEAFDLGMINYARYLDKKGLLKPPHYFNLIAGNVAGAQADLLHIGVMLRELPPGSFWSLGGIGNAQIGMNLLGIAAGGGIRVGLEDNIWFDPERTRLASNVDCLKRMHDIIRALGKQVMPAATLRRQLGLLPGNGQYGRLAEGATNVPPPPPDCD